MYRIKEILDKKGMSGKELADRMNVTPQYISGIIREKGSASINVLANIAKVLEVPLASLFDDYDAASASSHTLICPHCGKGIKIKAE